MAMERARKEIADAASGQGRVCGEWVRARVRACAREGTRAIAASSAAQSSLAHARRGLAAWCGPGVDETECFFRKPVAANRRRQPNASNRDDR